MTTTTKSKGEIVHVEPPLALEMRDWFAGMALIGAISRFKYSFIDENLMSQVCYKMADAMLAERKREK